MNAYPSAVPVVGDRDGNIGGPRIGWVPDIAGNAHAAPVAAIQRAERFVIVVIQLGEVAQLRW